MLNRFRYSKPMSVEQQHKFTKKNITNELNTTNLDAVKAMNTNAESSAESSFSIQNSEIKNLYAKLENLRKNLVENVESIKMNQTKEDINGYENNDDEQLINKSSSINSSISYSNDNNRKIQHEIYEKNNITKDKQKNLPIKAFNDRPPLPQSQPPITFNKKLIPLIESIELKTDNLLQKRFTYKLIIILLIMNDKIYFCFLF
jgi:hypothetical protein